MTDQTSREARRDTRPIGRLEAELRHIYSDALHAPLPSRLQTLIDRLEDALGSAPNGCSYPPADR